MNLYFIRHGRQSSSLCNVNVDLSNEGREQAQLLAKRFKDCPVDVIYSSNLIRAVQTAEYMMDYHHVEHIIREDLKEIEFGELTGLTDQQIANQFSEFLSENKKMEEDMSYPGGENGQVAFIRAKRVIDEMITKGYENVVIVTHGGIIRSLMAGLFTEKFAWKAQFGVSLENTSITHIIYKREEGRFYLQRFNDYAHLEQKPELLRHNWK